MDREQIIVSCIKNVLDPLAEGSREIRRLDAGRMVAEYVGEFYPSLDRELYDLSIAINGEPLEGDDRVTRIVPAGSSLVFCATPRDSDKNPLAILGMLAVLAFAYYAAPALASSLGLTGSAAKIATGIAAGGIIGVGGTIVNAVFPPSLPDFGGMEEIQRSPTYSWDIRGNNLLEGGAIPNLYGTHRVKPPIVSRFLETSGDKQYLNILYAIAGHEIDSISSIRINEQDKANFKNVRTEKRLGTNDQAVIQFFENTVTGTSVQTKIVDTSWINKTTTGNAVEGLGVVIVLPKGLGYFQDNGSISSQTIKLLMEYKKQGESVWTRAKFATETEIQVPVSRWSAGCWHYGGEDGDTWFELEAGSTNPGDYDEGDPYEPSEWWDYGEDARPDYYWRWIVTDEYVTEKKVVTNSYIEITGQQTSAIRRTFYIDNIPDGAGTYDLRVAFETTPPSGTRYLNEAWWESIQEVVYDDFRYPNTTLLGVRALATDQLQNAMPRIDMLATRNNVPVWTGSGYEDKPANNPAWACYDKIHRGGDLIPYSKIDYTAFNNWASWCTTKGYTCNIYFDSILSLREALNIVSVLGRGMVLQIGSKFTAIYDNDSALPTQKFLFSIGNIIRNSFATEYLALDDRANAIELTYFDSTLDHTRQTIELYSDDFDTTSEEIRKSQVTLYGCTSRSMAIKHAKFLLNCNRYITITASWEADVDAIVCVPGDVVEVQHDVPQWGIGGRVVSATSTSVTLDREVTIEGGKTYHITVKHQDDDAREERTVTNGAGTYTTLNISSAWTKTPVKHAIYSFGEVNKLMRQFRVIRIESTADQRRRITGIEYNSNVYSDSATVPAPPAPPGIPVPTNLVANENWQGGKVSSVTLTWQGYAPKWNVFVHAPNKPYRLIGSTPLNKFDVIGLDFGVNLTFAVSSTEFPSDGEEVSLTLVGPGTGVTTPTFDAGSCSFTDRVKLRWGALTDEHLAGYELRTDLNWGNDANLIFKGMATYFEMEGGQTSYTFYIKSFSIYGGYSASYDQVTVTNTAPATPVVTTRYDDRDILLTWTPPTELDYKETRVQVFQEAGRTTMLRNELATGNNYLYTFAMNRANYPSPGPNWNVYFRVIHYDKFGSNSQADPTVNNTSPGLPTGCSATGSFKTIAIGWTNPTDIDLDVIEVYRSSSNDSSTATKIGEIRGILYIDSGLGSAETWYYWLKSRDTSGNLSGFCHGQYSGHSATTIKIATVDVTDGAIDQQKLAPSLTFIDVVGALPGSGMSEGDVVYLTTDDKLYRYDGSQWIVDVAAGDITGQITTTQIGDNQITTPKINALAVTAGKIAADAVESDKIKANAVIAGKIAAGAVGADEVAANSIVSSKLVIGNFTNFVPNPDFATGDFTGWSEYPGGESGTTVVAAASAPAGCPTPYCCKFSTLATVRLFSHATYWGDSEAPEDGISVIPGEKYRVIVSLAKDSGFSGTPQVYIAYIKDDDSTASDLIGSPLETTTWTDYGYDWTVPSNAVRAYVYLRSTIGAGAVYWTNIRMYRKNEGALIVDGAITADKLAANSVIADKIAAQAIVSNRLLIGNFDNLLPNWNWGTGDLKSWSPWSNPSYISIVAAASAPSGAPSRYVCKFAASGTSVSMFSHEKAYDQAGANLDGIGVVAGEKYRVSAFAAKDGSFNGTARLYIYYKKKDDTFASVFSDILSLSTSWQDFAFDVSVPADCVNMWLYLYVSGFTAGNMYWANPRITRRYAGELIVDGEIITDKLAANAVTSGKIAANQITATHVGSNEIIAQTANLKNLVVQTAKIADQAVTIPSSAYTEGTVAVPAQTLTTIQSVTFTSTGAPCFIVFSCECYASSGMQGYVQIWRDSTNIREMVIPAYGNAYFDASFSMTDTPSAGSRTYYVKAYYQNVGNAGRRSLMVLETKK
jgi:hypothetical protein